MITKLDNYKSRMEYIALLHPYTLINIFERPDDDEVIHTYIAYGEYRASWADEIVFWGTASDAKQFIIESSKLLNQQKL